MLSREVVKNIIHTFNFKGKRFPAFLSFVTVFPVGYILARHLTSKLSNPHHTPSIPKKEDEIFSLLSENNVDRIFDLTKQNPNCLSSFDRRGRLPLHVLCQKSFPNKEIFLTFIKGNPEAATVSDRFFGALPLHMAVHHGISLAF